LKKNKKIFVCPLDWGLGHATRTIPIVRSLLNKGVEVVIGADQRPYALLHSVFPELTFIRFPGLSMQYPRNGNMAFQVLRSLPGILSGIRIEHKALNPLIDMHQFDAIISDNRFGLWHREVPCIYVTHQLMVKAPGILSYLEPVLQQLHNNIIKKYTACWIPDYPGQPNLSGDLSHKYEPGVETRFIGPLSRFSRPDAATSEGSGIKRIDLLIVISGPEPQRSILEQIILDQLKTLDISAIVVLGLPEKASVYQLKKNITVFSSLEDELMREYMLHADHIICRPGYSSIMDLHILGRKAIFIPTPGQTEQEYLAHHLSIMGFESRSQKKLDIKEILTLNSEKIWDYKGKESGLLDQAIDDLINNI